MLAHQWALVLASVGLSAAAQVMLKLGAGAAPTAPYAATLMSPWTLAGLAAYGLSALLWLRVLASLTLSQAYPFVALGVVGTSLLGVWLLDEPLAANRVAGTMLIGIGVILVGWR